MRKLVLPFADKLKLVDLLKKNSKDGMILFHNHDLNTLIKKELGFDLSVGVINKARGDAGLRRYSNFALKNGHKVSKNAEIHKKLDEILALLKQG